VFYRDACRCLHGEGWKIARTTCQEESSSTRRSAPAPAFEMRAHRFLRAHGPGHTTLYSEMCAACCAYETHQGQIEDICDPWEEPIRNLSSRALINLSSASHQSLAASKDSKGAGGGAPQTRGLIAAHCEFFFRRFCTLGGECFRRRKPIRAFQATAYGRTLPSDRVVRVPFRPWASHNLAPRHRFFGCSSNAPTFCRAASYVSLERSDRQHRELPTLPTSHLRECHRQRTPEAKDKGRPGDYESVEENSRSSATFFQSSLPIVGGDACQPPSWVAGKNSILSS